MFKERYRITAKAGYWVAGHMIRAVKVQEGRVLVERPDPGATLLLTEQEARYELLAGTIEPAPVETTPAEAPAETPADPAAPARRLKRR